MEPLHADDWHRLYGESWKGAIDDESFAHPAKYARGLIRRIYEHMLEEDWLRPGDTVLDPFGGVALGALHTTQERLNWVGMELEERFVLMGNRNIQRWEEMYRAGGYEHGSAYLYHGDSRYLSLLLGRRANGCVSSPPYAGSCAHTGGNDPHPEYIQGGAYHGVGIEGAISSPPYASSAQSTDGDFVLQSTGVNPTERKLDTRAYFPAEMGTAGQMGAMQEGEFQAAVSSPPYNLPMSQDHSGRGGGTRGTTPSEKGAFAKYGNSPGQLEGLPMGDFEACVSSPPYSHPAKGISATEMDKKMKRINEARLERGDIKGGIGRSGRLGVSIAAPDGYGTANGQLGAEQGDTFWAASRQVLEQTYQVLTPGAHAIFVCKDFVRDKQRVPFSRQWAQLCVAVGFEWLHEHRAWVVEEYGTQMGLFGEDSPIVKERKSFFRRLAEKNGSPRIDWESVLCFRKGGL